MRKRGQFYIFSIIILLSLVYVLVPKQSLLHSAKDSEMSLYANFRSEAPYFANNALLNDDERIIRNFTHYFLDFAKEKGVSFEIVYAFCGRERLTVFSGAKEAHISAGANFTLLFNESHTIPKVNFINITIDDKIYGFSLLCPDFKAVLMAKSGKAKRVFVYGG